MHWHGTAHSGLGTPTSIPNYNNNPMGLPTSQSEERNSSTEVLSFEFVSSWQGSTTAEPKQACSSSHKLLEKNLNNHPEQTQKSKHIMPIKQPSEYQWPHFPFPVLPPNTPRYPSLILFKFMAYFFINCCYILIWIYICSLKYMSTTWSACMLLLLCMFLGMTVQHWITNWCGLPKEDSFALSFHELPIILCAVWGLSHLPCWLVPFLLSSRLVIHVGETLWEYLLTFLKTRYHSKLSDPLAFTVFHSGPCPLGTGVVL